jgi:subtilisin-like proprotein convertase family protein
MEYDSQVNGTWTLRVVDTAGGNAGTLRSWSLELTSRWD